MLLILLLRLTVLETTTDFEELEVTIVLEELEMAPVFEELDEDLGAVGAVYVPLPETLLLLLLLPPPPPLGVAGSVPTIGSGALRGNLRDDEPTYTVLGKVLMYQSWAFVSQLLKSLRVSCAVNVSEAPGAMENLSNWRKATTASLGPPNDTYNCATSSPSTPPVFVTVAVTVNKMSYRRGLPPGAPPAFKRGCGEPSYAPDGKE